MAQQHTLSAFSKILFSLMILLCSALGYAAKTDLCLALSQHNSIQALPAAVRQVILVTPQHGIDALVSLCQLEHDHWQNIYSHPFPAVLGSNGIAAIGTKKEGDRKTPAGLFPIGEAFGTRPLAVKLDFRYVTTADKFIDDPENPAYNSWVVGPTTAKSYEAMRIPAYTYGLVVNYNKHPTVPGAGSAIFIHMWQSPSTSTQGCIALDKHSLLKLLHWLDKTQAPHVFIKF